MASLMKTDGTVTRNIRPANGTDFTLEELYALIGCTTVEMLPIQHGLCSLWFDEDGKSKDLPLNTYATAVAHETGNLPRYDYIVGNALLTDAREVT